MSKKMIVTNQYLRCSNCVDRRFICKSFKLFGKMQTKIPTTIILNVRSEWLYTYCNVSIINIIISYLHFPIILNIMLLVFILQKKRRKGERRENRKRTQDMNFVCLSAPPEKTISKERCHRFSRVLLISFTLCFLLLTILLSIALISKYNHGKSSNEKERIHWWDDYSETWDRNSLRRWYREFCSISEWLLCKSHSFSPEKQVPFLVTQSEILCIWVRLQYWRRNYFLSSI